MKLILIIEDEPDVLESIADILEAAGFLVKTAVNGFEGVKLAREAKPDLIICDIAMPGLTGYDVIKQIRSESGLEQIPFIFLTAKADLEEIREGMQLGADDYITKPFRALDLIKSVNIRLERFSKLRKAAEASPEKRLDYDQKIFISSFQNARFIQISEIVAITANADYSNIHLRDGSKNFVRRLLKEWHELLPEKKFIRIHRSTIINVDYILKADKWFKRSLIILMKDIDQSFVVSERYVISLKKELGI